MLRHLWRLVVPNHARSAPTDRERARFASSGVVSERVMRYLVWRRSILLIALPILLLAAVTATISVIDADRTALNPVGQSLLWLPVLSVWAAPVAAALGLAYWTDPARGGKILMVSWLVSVAVPVVLALVPLDAFAEMGVLQQIGEERLGVGMGDTFVEGLRLLLAVEYAATLLPTVISVPSGVLRGASRMRGLLPQAPLPGWFLVAVAPFAAFLTLVAFVLLVHLAGTRELVLGVGLMTAAPLQYLVLWRAWTDTTGRASVQRTRTIGALVGTLLAMAGIAVIGLWALSAELNGRRLVGTPDALFGWPEVARTIAEYAARSLLASVVFTQIFLTMTIRHWRDVRTLTPEESDALTLDIDGFAGVSSAALAKAEEQPA